MVELGKSTLTRQDLISVIKPAMEAGKDAEAIADMVAERISNVVDLDDVVTMLAEAPSTYTPPNDEGAVIYDDVFYEPGQLPDGLIDLPSASKKYGIPISTLQSWLRRGKLQRRGRVRARAAGGGYVVTKEAEIVYCRDNPRKRGPKSFARP